jgi:hypothetical protein
LAYARFFSKINKLRIAKQHRFNLPPFSFLDKFGILKQIKNLYIKKIIKALKSGGRNFTVSAKSQKLPKNFPKTAFGVNDKFNHLIITAKTS